MWPLRRGTHHIPLAIQYILHRCDKTSSGRYHCQGCQFYVQSREAGPLAQGMFPLVAKMLQSLISMYNQVKPDYQEGGGDSAEYAVVGGKFDPRENFHNLRMWTFAHYRLHHVFLPT